MTSSQVAELQEMAEALFIALDALIWEVSPVTPDSKRVRACVEAGDRACKEYDAMRSGRPLFRSRASAGHVNRGPSPCR